LGVVIFEEAVDGGLEVDHGSERAALEAAREWPEYLINDFFRSCVS
jgi:hypothetical protein